jgi:hypothetical protein
MTYRETQEARRAAEETIKQESAARQAAELEVFRLRDELAKYKAKSK